MWFLLLNPSESRGGDNLHCTVVEVRTRDPVHRSGRTAASDALDVRVDFIEVLVDLPVDLVVEVPGTSRATDAGITRPDMEKEGREASSASNSAAGSRPLVRFTTLKGWTVVLPTEAGLRGFNTFY